MLSDLADLGTGGVALAFAMNASLSTVSEPAQRLHSILGHYLAAARTDRVLHATVSVVRNTKNFATRTVLVTQLLDDGTTRAVLSAQLDYQRVEPASLLTYSAHPPASVTPLSKALGPEEGFAVIEKLEGSSPAVLKIFKQVFGPLFHFFDWKYDPASLGSQNMLGMLRKARTSQDSLPITEKSTFDWWRSKTPLHNLVEQTATLGFLMDAGLSFNPLTHSHMFLQDAAACSSLDFAVRIFVNDFDLNKWHLKDIRTVRGGSGRTYSVSGLFDEDGDLVAEMSQQSILRPHREKKAKI